MLVFILAVGSFTSCGNENTSQTKADNKTNKVENQDKKEEKQNKEEESKKQDDSKKLKKGILVTSFGTSYADTRKVTIEAAEKRIAEAFPEYEVRRAFTSNIIIKKLKERDNIQVDTLAEGLAKMKEEGFTEVIVQPLHIIPGAEYSDIVEEVTKFNDGSFEKLALGRPILTHINDYEKAVEALKVQLPELKDDQAVVVMGHGTHHPANASYACLQDVIDKNDLKVYVGTVEGYPDVDDVIRKLKADEINEVTLMPYMVVAGDHAQNDMAGDEEDSWKTILKKEGFTVNIYLHGLGENKEYQDIYIEHVKDAIEGNGEEINKPVVSEAKGNWQEGKKGMLVVSFGTSYADTRKVTIEAVEKKMAEEFTDYEVRRAFTSNIIIKKLKERDNILVDTPEEALMKMKEEGFEEVIIQPLHVIAGAEYTDLLDVVKKYEKDTFKKISVGKPILNGPHDYKTAVEAFKVQLPELKDDQAVVVMGHGTHHPANSSYACLQSALNDEGLKVYVGTVEGYPELEDVIARLKADNIKEVTLMPYMVVSGDHAQNDMAGDEEDSWKTILKKEGFTVNTYLHGLGENTEYQNIYIQHAKDAIKGEE